jgi:hypothetical protein
MKKSFKMYLFSNNNVINKQIPCMKGIIQGIWPLTYHFV